MTNQIWNTENISFLYLSVSLTFHIYLPQVAWPKFNMHIPFRRCPGCVSQKVCEYVLYSNYIKVKAKQKYRTILERIN